MKYKVGDKVRIHSKEWYDKHKDECGNIKGAFFDKERAKFCGTVQTIASTAYVSGSGKIVYAMEDAYEFIGEEAIEGLAEEEQELSQNAKLVSRRFSEDVNVSEFKHAQDEIMKMLLQGAINVPEGYEFRDENGNIIEAKVITLEKKKPKYPQSYEECCKVLDIDDRELVFNGEYRASKLYWKQLGRLNILNRVLICRDAYWKLAGEEMGLGKPWEPDFTNFEEDRYGLYTCANKIVLDSYGGGDVNVILTFPTEEMRDAFYENFKKLIESCKELL